MFSRLREKNELKIGIEAITKCGGSCDGCLLTKQERQSSSDFFIDRDSFSILSKKLSQYVCDIEDEFGSIDDLAINLGQGDHFLLNEDDLNFYVEWMKEAFNGVGNCFITTSAISSFDTLKKKVDLLHKKSIDLNQMLLLDIVYSPEKGKLNNFSSIYKKNISYLLEKFGGADFVINLGVDILNTTSPLELYEFVLENKIPLSTIVLSPNVYISKNKKEYISWLNDYYKLWIDNMGDLNKHQFEINYGSVLAVAMESDLLNGNQDHCLKEIYIDSKLDVYFGQTSIGDFGLTDRFGFKPLFNVRDDGSILSNLKKALVKLEMIKTRTYLNKNCLQCDFYSVCKNTFLPYTVQHDKKEDCINGLKPLMENIKFCKENNLDNNSSCYVDNVPITQSGLSFDKVKTKGIKCIVEGK